MVSFKQYIQESEDNKSFDYVKLGPLTAYGVNFDVDFKGKTLKLGANIKYEIVYKIPIWNGDVDFTSLSKIKIHDVDVIEVSGINEMVRGDDGQIYYHTPFKDKKDKNEKDYVISIFTNYFIDGLKDGSVENISITDIASRAQKILQRRRGNDIL